MRILALWDLIIERFRRTAFRERRSSTRRDPSFT
jgi:hypothetical protein